MLADDLATDAAGAAAAFEIAGDGDGDDVPAFDLACRILFVDIECVGANECFGEGGAFGTDGTAVRGVLVVGAEDDLAPLGQEGSADAELAVGSTQ